MKLQVLLLLFGFVTVGSPALATDVNVLRVVGDKVWAMLSSLGLSEELGVTKGDLALLEVFSLSDYKAEVLAVAQHLQGFVSELSVFVADVEAVVKGLFDLADISDAGAADTFDKIVGFLTSLGISKADVKLAVDGAVGLFFKSLSIKDVPALFADMHGLLVAAGVPHGSPQAAMHSFLNEAKALKSLILS